MSKHLVHVLIPYTTQVACGAHSHYEITMARDNVTCKACKKTDWYKQLPSRHKSKSSNKRSKT